MFTTSLTANDLLFLLQGAWTTLAITAMAMLIGTLLGVVFGLLRALLPRASLPLAALLDVFRSVPLLIQFVLLNSFKSILGLDWSAFAVACLVLGVYAAAYCTEVVRGGVLSVPPSVRRAARSLGLSYRQDLFHIVLPMAARVAFPGWVNLTLSVMKDTSLVLWIGIVELLRASQTIVTRIRGTALRALHRGARLLPHELGGRATRRPAGTEMAAMIEISDVHKAYGQFEVVKGVDLRVDKGEVLSIIGGSGSGKSTLLMCINGLEPIQRGSIRVDGIDVHARGTDLNRLRRKIGIVFQQWNAFPT